MSMTQENTTSGFCLQLVFDNYLFQEIWSNYNKIYKASIIKQILLRMLEKKINSRILFILERILMF